MSKQLFTVEIATDAVVLAESREEAEKIAQSIRLYEPSDFSYIADQMTFFPYGWDGKAFPYGTVDDQTIDQLIEQGAAPLLRKK